MSCRTMSFWCVGDYEQKDEQRKYSEEMKTDCFKWDGIYSSIEQGILWYSSKKRYLYSMGSFYLLKRRWICQAE